MSWAECDYAREFSLIFSLGRGSSRQWYPPRKSLVLIGGEKSAHCAVSVVCMASFAILTSCAMLMSASLAANLAIDINPSLAS